MLKELLLLGACKYLPFARQNLQLQNSLVTAIVLLGLSTYNRMKFISLNYKLKHYLNMMCRTQCVRGLCRLFDRTNKNRNVENMADARNTDAHKKKSNL